MFHQSSSSRDGDILTSTGRSFPRVPLGCLAPLVLRLTSRYIEIRSNSPCVSRAFAAHVLRSQSRAAAFRRKRSLGYFLLGRVGCSITWNSKWTQRCSLLECNERPRAVSRSIPTAPTRSKEVKARPQNCKSNCIRICLISARFSCFLPLLPSSTFRVYPGF